MSLVVVRLVLYNCWGDSLPYFILPFVYPAHFDLYAKKILSSVQNSIPLRKKYLNFWRHLDLPSFEVPSRFELLYTVLQTAT